MIVAIPTNHREEIKEDRVTRASEVGTTKGRRTVVEAARRPLWRYNHAEENVRVSKKEKGKGARIGTRGRELSGRRREKEEIKACENGPGENSGNDSPRIASRSDSHFTQRRPSRWPAIVRRIFYTVWRWKAIKIVAYCALLRLNSNEARPRCFILLRVDAFLALVRPSCSVGTDNISMCFFFFAAGNSTRCGTLQFDFVEKLAAARSVAKPSFWDI